MDGNPAAQRTELLYRLKNLLRRAKRYAFSFYILNKNRVLGRSFVPPPHKRLFIEPVSFCNLVCKFCTYPKNLHPRTVMEDDLFRKGIDQASAMGIDEVVLTPINGDVFMDKNIIDRMTYIERSAVRSHMFYTNFIAADESAIAAILAMKKLRYMEISVYGHDLESFCNITGRGEVQYRRLIDNLTTLERLFAGKRDDLRIVIAFRTYRSFRLNREKGNDLLDVVRRLQSAGVEIGLSSLADNWGGDITKDDIAGIGMDLIEGRHLYRKGPCGLPFDSVQVTASGQVNACACRDPRGTLSIGDLRTEPLSEILSSGNRKWLKIIEDHDAGRFNDICASCGFYQSIHDERRAGGADGGEMIRKDDYISLLMAKDRQAPQERD